jgi:hypothetical protein
MSDNLGFRPNWGNLSRRSHLERRMDRNNFPYPSRRPLVEEALFVNMRDVQQIYGRKKLLRAADEGRPISVQLGSHSFPVYLLWAPHHLPGRAERWSDISHGNCRIYFICPSCQRRIRILYENPRPLVSDLPPIGCRRCLHLVYASENSCKNIWWREIVRPLRHLYRQREKLFARKRTPRVAEELNQIEGLIYIYTQRAKPKRRTRILSGVKRPYRNVSMVIGLR